MSKPTGYKDELTEQDGLMRQERQILIAIYQGKIPADIARELGMTAQRVGAIRSTLVKKNWLERKPVPGTKRATYSIPESKVAAVQSMIDRAAVFTEDFIYTTTVVDGVLRIIPPEGAVVTNMPNTVKVGTYDEDTGTMVKLGTYDGDTGQPKSDTADTWEFIGQPPTIDQVRALLGTLPLVHGIRTSDYFEYVQAIPDFREVTRPNPDRPGSMITDRVEVWRLYMSVAGRLSMLNAAQALNSWRVDIVPEPASPLNPAGFLSVQPYIVYREHIKIWVVPGEDMLLGSRSGQAGKPFSSSAHPYEIVETSARGRALGGWGFGVFPGSGIASLDEMLSLAASKRTEQASGDGRPVRGTGAKQTKEELLEDVLTTNEQLRQFMGADEDTMTEKMGEYLASLGAKVWDAEQKTIDWDQVKPGQLVMLLGKLDERRKQWATETSL